MIICRSGLGPDAEVSRQGRGEEPDRKRYRQGLVTVGSPHGVFDVVVGQVEVGHRGRDLRMSELSLQDYWRTRML